jgi:PTS system nitrogen regulatory IIA component
VLSEREKLNTTGIGEGVAIPHGKLAGLPRLYASFGVCREGVDFASIDGKPTYLFFALVAPENSAGIHLKALARISRLFRNREFREAILQAPDAGHIYSLISEEDARA